MPKNQHRDDSDDNEQSNQSKNNSSTGIIVAVVIIAVIVVVGVVLYMQSQMAITIAMQTQNNKTPATTDKTNTKTDSKTTDKTDSKTDKTDSKTSAKTEYPLISKVELSHTDASFIINISEVELYDETGKLIPRTAYVNDDATNSYTDPTKFYTNSNYVDSNRAYWVYPSIWGPNNMVDGKPDTIWHSCPNTVASCPNVPPMARLPLAKPYPHVSKVIIKYGNGPQKSFDRITGVIIKLFDEDGMVAKTTTLKGQDEQTITLDKV